jgi:hypothetical protein
MLANLDNEVHFKKVFTNVEVFTAFVKDVLGIDIHIDKVETEKVLSPKASAIKFKMDLFAEDKENRTIVEIQKVDYDYTYDRFAHYFLGNLIDVQRSSKTYSFAKDVYVIVVVTSAYKISDKNGKPVKEEVMITDINPRNLKGEIIELNNHKMFVLNTSYANLDTPKAILDWLDLIRQSMTNPENPNINTLNPAIAKAANLAEKENLDPDELADAKIQEMKKEAVAIIEDQTRKETIIETRKETIDEGIENALNLGILTNEQIIQIFKVNLEYIKAIAERK